MEEREVTRPQKNSANPGSSDEPVQIESSAKSLVKNELDSSCYRYEGDKCFYVGKYIFSCIERY